MSELKHVASTRLGRAERSILQLMSVASAVIFTPRTRAQAFRSLREVLNELPYFACGRGLGTHTTTESASCLAGLITRKPTLVKLSLGEMAYDAMRMTELDIPIVAAAAMSYGADIPADRKAHAGTSVMAFGIGRAPPVDKKTVKEYRLHELVSKQDRA